MDEPNPDYVTVLPTHDQSGRKLVAVMHYHKRDDEYLITKVSRPLGKKEANQLAHAWAAALRLSVRLV